MITLENLIRVGGVCHFGILTASATLPLVLDWRKSLGALPKIERQLILAWASFIVLVIIGFGTVSLVHADDLAAGSTLGRAVCGFIAFFWSFRLAWQFFVYEVRDVIEANTRWLWVGYHGLTLVFIYFAVVYAMAALR
jgi:hypothetical protein